MELLEFARGPALTFAIVVFIAGVVFRITSLFLMWRTRDTSTGSARERPVFVAALREIARRMWPESVYKRQTMFQLVNGYVFHIGLAIIVFLLLPHILFFKDLFGISWPHLPNNLIYAVSVITAVSLIAALLMRMSNPAQRIISTFDDYFSWFVTVLPLVTGLMIPVRMGLRYEDILAIHVLSVVLLMIWFPFGKLGHAFLVLITRGTTGMVFERRGAKT